MSCYLVIRIVPDVGLDDQVIFLFLVFGTNSLALLIIFENLFIWNSQDTGFLHIFYLGFPVFRGLFLYPGSLKEFLFMFIMMGPGCKIMKTNERL